MADIPSNMIEVTQEEFFDRLNADPRDIMPTTKNPYFTTWETRDGWVVGWDSTGWKNSGSGQDTTWAWKQ